MDLGRKPIDRSAIRQAATGLLLKRLLQLVEIGGDCLWDNLILILQIRHGHDRKMRIRP